MWLTIFDWSIDRYSRFGIRLGGSNGGSTLLFLFLSGLAMQYYAVITVAVVLKYVEICWNDGRGCTRVKWRLHPWWGPVPAPDGETSSAEVPSHQAPGCTSERGSKSMHWTVPTFRLQQEVEVQGPADEVLCRWCRGCSHDAFQCARFLAAGPAHSKVPAGGGRQIGAGGLPEAAGGEKASSTVGMGWSPEDPNFYIKVGYLLLANCWLDWVATPKSLSSLDYIDRYTMKYNCK